ncbi:hypothetical protein C2G38_2035922 [Gigaspora rosea]|uniref:Uncharacterized protein n=1 Tax=Gigaspora rosea TaxID=44941 RepID=A0A397VAX8_9GLOM|nr:hypothetical protein C2G38_2035922 [Gigaspora rosea]
MIIETVKENLKAFYVLLELSKEEPNPGFTFQFSSTDYHKCVFYQGLSLYSVIKEDGTQIILDLTNNDVGNVYVANIINKILFPNIQGFPVDMKVNNISISIQFIE